MTLAQLINENKKPWRYGKNKPDCKMSCALSSKQAMNLRIEMRGLCKNNARAEGLFSITLKRKHDSILPESMGSVAKETN